jgi:SHS2 domain-containing protein
LPTKTGEARTSDVRARAEANFKKEERAKEGAKAMLEYQTNSRVVREKMSRLKALRLAKEAADKEAVAAAPPAAKAKVAAKLGAKSGKR